MESQTIEEGQVPGSLSASPASEVADSWTVAALAHASIAVTLLLSFAGGIGALVGPAIALAIYFGYRQRSRFVAYHALQAVAYQATGLVLYLVLVAVLVTATGSYMIFRRLIGHPLHLLTTSIETAPPALPGEMVDWHSDDAIGRVIDSYNTAQYRRH